VDNIKGYEDLLVWQKGMELAEHIYLLVRLLPKEEQYALSSQMRRAAISIPSNIAEGQSRSGTKEFSQFLSIAKGSSAELLTQLLLCERIAYLTEEETKRAKALCYEIGRMLSSLIKKLATEKM